MITGVILARNEQRNIAACIRAFKPHVNELFLIDMESEDNTVRIAEPLVDRVLPHALISPFDAARNIAIEPATYDWIWFCDADERVSEFVGRTVREVVRNQGDTFEALSIPFKSYFCGKWIEHCGWWPGFTMPRVMKKGFFRFRDELHSGVQVDGREVRLPAEPSYGIDHFSYESVEHYYEKFNRYTSAEAKKLASTGSHWDWKAATQAMIRDMWQYYERNEGHLDKAHGWILSWLSGQYRWSSYAKLLDARKGDPRPLESYPRDLNEFVGEMQRELHRLRTPFPKPPLGVVLRTPWRDPSGYADEGRSFAKALASGERAVRLEEIAWSDRLVDLNESDRMLFGALSNVAQPVDAIAITSCIPTVRPPIPGARFNVLRTTFETDRVPEEWLPHLNAYDEVWVMSRHNERAFIRSGFPPERLRHVPSCIDETMFKSEGEQLVLPVPAETKFVFLSIFDWQLRKGWDVLLPAYAAEFSANDGTVLLLKVSRSHGHPMEVIHEQADRALATVGASLDTRPDIVLWDQMLSVDEMAKLYRSVDAFVLPTRGEGWGRPYMEAMACGTPTIGTAASGNIDFMTMENSLLIRCEETPVSQEGFREIVTYEGQSWFEPNAAHLRQHMRSLHDDEALWESLSEQGIQDIHHKFSIGAGRIAFEEAIQETEALIAPADAPIPGSEQIHVELQGEVFANHSFSNINEWLTAELGNDPDVAFSVNPRFEVGRYEFSARHARVKPFLNRSLSDGPQITIRHAYPPDWSPVPHGKWVHIQPWEFGYLPVDWVEPLRDRVDEIWAPSNYVRDVYINSGVPGEKIHVIPWGVDDRYFHADAPPRFLSTNKRFKFVWVGGTIARKGFDVLLNAYLREFNADDDVCLVIKDVGHKTVYRPSNHRERIFAAQRDPGAPDILYIDDDYTPGQLASLYAACDCLVAPYRGEGFGLPILESMACGVAVVVPKGGPTDDFVDESCGYVLPSRFVESRHPDALCGEPTEIAVEQADVQRFMRAAINKPAKTKSLGEAAAQRVAKRYSWRHCALEMKRRMLELVGSDSQVAPKSVADDKLPLTVVVDAGSDTLVLADCLARVVIFASQVVVCCDSNDDDCSIVAREYGAKVMDNSQNSNEIASQPYILRIDANIRFQEIDWRTIANACINTSDIKEIQLATGKSVAIQKRGAKPQDPSLQFFWDRFYPYLEKRAESFRFILEYLERLKDKPVSIVETGCVRMPDDWGAGQSTLIFDSWIGENQGRFLSVDIDPENCEFARRLCNSSMTTIENSDSLVVLQRLATEAKQTIDLLYLDSLDVDWNNPGPSGLHHLKELCAVRPALKPGALVVVDDHRNELGQPGKSLHVCDLMQSIGARVAFEGYQIGWFLP